MNIFLQNNDIHHLPAFPKPVILSLIRIASLNPFKTKKMKQVREVMSKGLITASPESTVGDLRRLMTRYHIGAVPIVLGGDTTQPVGIVTDLDLRNVKEAALQASSVMTTVLHSVSPNASVASAANVMLQYGIHHLLVKDRQELVGLVSALDLLTVVADTRSPFANRMIFM